MSVISITERKHQNLMTLYQGNELTPNERSILIRNHRFIRDDEDDNKMWKEKWEVRMAKRYYDKLYKEYALVDLSRYKESKIGMRWRYRNEVIDGKGQFSCGNLHCVGKCELKTYEVPFKYKEDNTVKDELVKVRVCIECAKKLFYKKVLVEKYFS